MARATAKRFFGTLLFLIALVMFLGFVFLLFADSQNLEDVPFVEEINSTSKIVGIILGFVALLLAIIILVRAGRKTDDEEVFFIPENDQVQLAYSMDDWPEDYDDAPGDGLDIQVYHLPAVGRQMQAWDKPEKRNVFPYYFPRSVEHALYANDYITIDHEGRKLKLRTLIAGPKDGQKAPLPKPRPIHTEKLRKEQEERAAEEEARIKAEEMAKVGPGDGESFMEQLEAKRNQPRDDGVVARDEIYYGYAGDNEAVDTVPGIPSDHVAALKANGVNTIARLCYEDPTRLADKLRVTPAEVGRWQASSELMKVSGIGTQYAAALAKAGVDGIAGLKRRSAKALAEEVNTILEADGGTKISASRIEGWQEAATSLRRTKQRVPSS